MKHLYFVFLLISCLNGHFIFAQKDDSTKAHTVFIMDIKDEIDARSNRYVRLALEEAKSLQATHIIIDMNTYGGALYDADEIRTALLQLEIPVYVFINKNAASAGALISIACDSIYMTPGASIGAATVVNQTGEAAPDKYQSYMRSIMRSTAEASGRDPRIAEAMVDQNLIVDSISAAGAVITFSTKEAIQYGYCEGEFSTLSDLLASLKLDQAKQINFQLGFTEKIISFFVNPFISGILILIIIGGLYFELQSPGIGFPILASAIALVLYLVPYYLNGLAENWEILAFVVGLILLALEVFVIPGFGVFGISGIIVTLGALIFMMLNNNFFDFEFVAEEDILKALLTTLAGLLGGVLLILIGGLRFTDSKYFKKIALVDTQDSKDGYSSRFIEKGLIGKTGSVYSVLRPSGKIEIEGNLYDAYSRGEYLEEGTIVEVIEESGTSIKVKKKEN